MNSLEDIHARIEHLELDQDDGLITADVKDFFVVGEHWYLARMAASIVEPMDRSLIEREGHSVFTPKPIRDQHAERIRWNIFKKNKVRASDLLQLVKLMMQLFWQSWRDSVS